MKRKVVFFAFIMLTSVVLAGCGMLTVTSQRMQFALEPTGNLGYEADSSGVTIQQRTMRFRNSAGAKAAYLTGYSIAFFDSAGNEVKPGDNSGTHSSMSLYVPAGIQCSDPDPVLGCTMLSEGAVIAPGPEVVTSETFNLLPAGIAELHLADWMASGTAAVGWYAEITFNGFTQDQQPFQTLPYVLHIAPPN